MLKLHQKICKCGKKVVQNRRKCYQCILQDKRQKRAAKLASQKLSKEKKKARFEQSETYRKRLFKKAWKVFNEAIRCVNQDDGSFKLICYTCGKILEPKEAHAGHFIHNKLDFDERNIHPQCPKCNTFLHGNLGAYAEHLIEDGINLKVLRRDAEIKGNGYTIKELREIIEKYENPL